MTAKEYLQKHVANIDAQLAELRYQATHHGKLAQQHGQQAQQLIETTLQLQRERDEAQAALEAEGENNG